ncbi:MAG: 5'-3' exonuclease [Chloroflexota bacterium]|nr:MAG: 5'-3' exonuclease [Chloroflexota bacterium]
MATDWLLIDGSSVMFRAFFGIPVTAFKAPDGQPVNAVRGFLDMLGRLVTDRKPRAIVVATDKDWRPAFRVDVLPSYKTHRLVQGNMPPELEPQEPIIHTVLAAIGVEVMGAEGFEAEDVIASLLPRLTGTVEIVTGDRDLFALVRDPDVRVLYTQQGIGRLLVVDEAEVERRYGIPGRSYGDFAVLRGDPSDGLPGVPGVGEKTAAQLVRRYKDLDGIIASGRLGDAANAYIERARRVGVPVSVAPVPIPKGARPTKAIDPGALAKLNERYGIGSVTERLLRALAGPPAAVRTPPGR